MKTAISLPDELFERVTKRAQELGISRSEFFADAARQYLETVDRASLTARINEALELVGDDEETTALVTAHGLHMLAQSEW